MSFCLDVVHAGFDETDFRLGEIVRGSQFVELLHLDPSEKGQREKEQWGGGPQEPNVVVLDSQEGQADRSHLSEDGSGDPSPELATMALGFAAVPSALLLDAMYAIVVLSNC